MKIIKTFATVSGLTLLSRVSGLARETLTAGLFGAGAQTDAFFLAFRLPNLLRRLFAEGAFSQAFVPVLGQLRTQQGDEAAGRFAGLMGLLLALSVGLITLVGIVGAPVLVYLLSGGFSGNADQTALATEMTQWMFPYIFLISLCALASGMLNTWGEFRIPALTPVLLNLAFIGSALILAPRLEEPIWALVVAVVMGGLLQLGLQVWGLARRGLLRGWGGLILRPLRGLREAWASEPVRRAFRLMLPASLAVSVAQISLLINTHIAARLETGSVSWLTYADRLMEFPTAMIGVALGTVLLTGLSRAYSSGDEAEGQRLVNWGLQVVVLLSLPAMAGLYSLSTPLAAVLFHYGAFQDRDLLQTALAMQAYSAGLLGLIAIKVLAPAFYARQDVRTPVKIAIFSLVSTQLLNLLFVPLLGHAGLALATSLAAWLNAGLLYWRLVAMKRFSPSAGWWRLIGQALIASTVMGLVCWQLAAQVDWVATRETPFLRIGLMAGVLTAAGLVYFGTLWMLGRPPRSLFRIGR